MEACATDPQSTAVEREHYAEKFIYAADKLEELTEISQEWDTFDKDRVNRAREAAKELLEVE